MGAQRYHITTLKKLYLLLGESMIAYFYTLKDTALELRIDMFCADGIQHFSISFKCVGRGIWVGDLGESVIAYLKCLLFAKIIR